MTDTTLRDRIAAAVCNWHYCEATAWEESADSSRQDWQGCADAVIEALGLRREWGALAHDDSGFLYDRRDEVKPSPGETVHARWITEWEAEDDE